jgi:hypothetical protein
MTETLDTKLNDTSADSPPVRRHRAHARPSKSSGVPVAQRLLDVNEAAAMLGLKPSTLYSGPMSGGYRS